MRDVSLWRALIGVEQTVVEEVELDPDGTVVVTVRPSARAAGRCGVCGRRSPGYDRGRRRRRRWRSLDVGSSIVVLQAHSPRVRCRTHGVVAARVPWARHGAGHTRAFDDQVAWLAVRASRATVSQFMRVAWRTVGAIIERVAADAMAGTDQLAGLRRIGIDEVSYRRGHKYLVVVVDHDTGRLVWAAPGRDRATVRRFFDELGPDRAGQLTHVSADSADWIAEMVTAAAPAAVQCADPFHIVQWANEALNALRIRAWRAARTAGQATRAGVSGRLGRGAKSHPIAIKNTRYPLLKNPANLTDKQQAKLAWIAKTDPRLWRGYQLKEGLRLIFALGGGQRIDALDAWISWARRCRIPEFVELQRRITKHYDRILATLTHGLSNALVESTNTKIRLLTRIAYGFHKPQALIAIAMLSLGGYCPPLPGRR